LSFRIDCIYPTVDALPSQYGENKRADDAGKYPKDVFPRRRQLAEDRVELM